jgi:cytochrome c1
MRKDDPDLARKAKDVSAFLEYAAEPSEGERRGLGGYVLGYMVLLTGLLYALNRRMWKRIRKTPS